MVEILGNNLKSLFENTKLNGVCTYKGIPKREYDITYEVWEISEEDFEIMCNMTEERFESYCPEGWWRHSEGSIFSTPYETNIVNGHKLISWSKGFFNCEETRKPKRYESLSDYLCNCIGASLPKNVCALSIDLAKYNNMKLSELFRKYEG